MPWSQADNSGFWRHFPFSFCLQYGWIFVRDFSCVPPVAVDHCCEELYGVGEMVILRRLRLLQMFLYHTPHPSFEGLASVEQALFDSRDRQLQVVSDLLLRVALDVEEDGDESLALRQPLDDTVDFLSQLHLFQCQGRVRERCVEAPGILQRNGCHELAALVSVAVADDDAPKPARKGGRVAQLRQVEIGVEACLLGNVLCQAWVTDCRVGTGIGHVLKTHHNLTKSIFIPVLCPPDQRW